MNFNDGSYEYFFNIFNNVTGFVNLDTRNRINYYKPIYIKQFKKSIFKMNQTKFLATFNEVIKKLILNSIINNELFINYDKIIFENLSNKYVENKLKNINFHTLEVNIITDKNISQEFGTDENYFKNEKMTLYELFKNN